MPAFTGGTAQKPDQGRDRGRVVLQALATLVAAPAAFVLASVLTRGLVEGAQPADSSGYAYLQGNLPMLLLALAAVYVVSSFGQEVVHRGS